MIARIVLLGAVLVSAAFQIQRPMVLGVVDTFTSPSTYREFFPAEGGLRWSTDRSSIVFPDPGPGVRVRVEVLLSGWRPSGIEAPQVVISARGQTATSRPGPGAHVVTLETVTTGWWRSDLVVNLQSDTFEPGPGDPRRLGVRVEEARLVPVDGGPRLPPLGAVVQTTLCALLVAFILRRSGMSPRATQVGAFTLLLLIAGLYAVSRPFAAIWIGPLFLVCLVGSVAAWLNPRATERAAVIATTTLRGLMVGLGRLRETPVIGLAMAGALLVIFAYRSSSRIEIDLGSGREVAVAQGFGAFEGKGDLKSRRTPRGAVIDLSDFGGGSPWKIEVVAALDGRPRDLNVVRAGGAELSLSLREEAWTQGAFSAPAPFGWMSGQVLEFPGGSDLLRVDRVAIERGPAWPSLRVLCAVVVIGLLGVIAFGAIGLPVMAGRVASALLMSLPAYALFTDPLAAIPFVIPFFWMTLAATALAATLAALFRVLDPEETWRPVPVALAAAVTGWLAWLAATAFPYYRGGHFIFHSSIAEEIWKGRFLIYYLPYPGSMLSEQAQWGQIVMPHPALYQTLVSPLSALPCAWFYLSEKVVLATLFASIVIVASMVAARVAGPRAAAFSAVVFASLVPGFQLLGLGHLMTILGVWASSLALPWLLVKVYDLTRFRTWLGTAWLFTLCFLSYTAALLFTGAVLVWLILMSARANPGRAKSLFTMLLAACTFAFLLYYVHWTLPFLLQSVPKILGGAGLGSTAAEATPILARLSLEPGKLSYSYGSMLIPLAGALGLWLLPRSWDRLVLVTWMGILFFVSAMDVFFNFLLKHHYYVMLPVAVGLGTLLTRVESRWGRVPVWIALMVIASLGLGTAIDVALGRIP